MYFLKYYLMKPFSNLRVIKPNYTSMGLPPMSNSEHLGNKSSNNLNKLLSIQNISKPKTRNIKNDLHISHTKVPNINFNINSTDILGGSSKKRVISNYKSMKNVITGTNDIRVDFDTDYYKETYEKYRHENLKKQSQKFKRVNKEALSSNNLNINANAKTYALDNIPIANPRDKMQASLSKNKNRSKNKSKSKEIKTKKVSSFVIKTENNHRNANANIKSSNFNFLSLLNDKHKQDSPIKIRHDIIPSKGENQIIVENNHQNTETVNINTTDMNNQFKEKLFKSLLLKKKKKSEILPVSLFNI